MTPVTAGAIPEFRPARPAAKRAATRPARCGQFLFCTEAKSLAQSQIQSEAARTCGVINWNDGCSRESNQIEAAIRSVFRTGRAGRTVSRRRTRVERRVSIQILSGSDIERRAGTGNHKRAQAKVVGKSDRAADKNAVANIERSAAIVLLQVKRI